MEGWIRVREECWLIDPEFAFSYNFFFFSNRLLFFYWNCYCCCYSMMIILLYCFSVP